MPQAHLPHDGELALAVDRTYRHADVTRAHLVAEISAWGLRDADDVVDHALATILDAVTSEIPHDRAHPDLVRDITTFTTRLIDGRPAGEAGV